MGPLRNSRHERFAQALFEGQSADEAYVTAGYSENRGNASRLKAKESVSMRVADLQSEAAKSSEVSVASLLAELEDARRRGLELSQIGSVVKSIEAKAKVSGRLVQRLEVTDRTPEPPNDASVEDIARWFSWHHEDYRVRLTDEQAVEFGRLMSDAFDSIRNFLAPLAAKPVPALPVQVDMETVERRRLGLTRR